jgi:hypothetical protein
VASTLIIMLRIVFLKARQLIRLGLQEMVLIYPTTILGTEEESELSSVTR